MKINTSPLCLLYTLMSQIISLLTLTLVRMWYEESNPRELEALGVLMSSPDYG